MERWDDDDRDDRNRTANANVAVSREEAVKTALGKVSGATEKDVRIELDYDDGRYRYEGYWNMQEMNEGGVCSPREDLRTPFFFVPLPAAFR